MDVTVLLCDYAQEVNGKLYVLGGGWSQLRAVGPADMALAVKLDLPWAWADRDIPMAAALLTEDGQQVEMGTEAVQFAAEIRATRPPELPPGTALDVALAIRFANLVLEPGGYRFELAIDGALLATVPFRVVA
jgi:hypothetical protein